MKSSSSRIMRADAVMMLLIAIFSGVLVCYPTPDPDTFWHLANGREMLAQQRIINEELFSYTREGTPFSNHEWLAQISLYVVYDLLGDNGLLAFRVVIAIAVSWLVFFSARALGATSGWSALAAAVAVLSGLHRYNARPELFSLLFIAWTMFLLHRFRGGALTGTALVQLPIIILLWDWLHGAVLGVALLASIGVAENVAYWLRNKSILSGLSPGLTVDRLRVLNLWLVAVLICALLNPYGILTYAIFVEFLQGNPLANNVAEFQPATFATLPVFWILCVVTSVTVLLRWKANQLAYWAILIPFTYLAIRYSRMTAVYGIVAAPILALHLSSIQKMLSKRAPRWSHVVTRLLLPLAAISLLGYAGYLKFMLPAAQVRFGIQVETKDFPEGIARFIHDVNVPGNMYNSGDLGGYLAYFSWPQQKIFQYNHHTVFGDTSRWVNAPHELAQWDIGFAIISHARELELFPPANWAVVYKDKKSYLLLRRTAVNAALISRYEIRHFVANPAVLLGAASNSTTYSRVVFETAVYLAYREDQAIAATLKEMLRLHREVALDVLTIQLLNVAARRNGAEFASAASKI